MTTYTLETLIKVRKLVEPQTFGAPALATVNPVVIDQGCAIIDRMVWQAKDERHLLEAHADAHGLTYDWFWEIYGDQQREEFDDAAGLL